MKAYLFSIGESTTEVAKWSLERHGFDVVLLEDPNTTLHDKYMQFLSMAKDEEVVLRWDADVIAKRELKQFVDMFVAQSEYWWMCGTGYCHLKHNLVPVSGQIMNNKVIRIGLKRMADFARASRPETELSRVEELCNPRRFKAMDTFIGIHAYKQREADDIRVLKVKEQRGQYQGWDHEFLDKLKTL